MKKENELDARVAEEIMGWEYLRVGYYGLAVDEEGATPRQIELKDWLEEKEVGYGQVGEYFIDVSSDFWISVSDWRPSSNMTDAWAVVEKMKEDGGYAWDEFYDDVMFKWFGSSGDKPSLLELDAADAARRICVAAVKAKKYN